MLGGSVSSLTRGQRPELWLIKRLVNQGIWQTASNSHDRKSDCSTRGSLGSLSSDKNRDLRSSKIPGSQVLFTPFPQAFSLSDFPFFLNAWQPVDSADQVLNSTFFFAPL